MLLWVDTTQGSFGLEREASAQKQDDKAMEFSVSERVQLTVLNPASASTTVRRLPAIRFLPDGSIDENSPQTLRLNDSTGATLWLVQTRNRMGYEIRNTNK